MSLYTLAASSLTTARDRGRHPAADRGQIARALALAVLLAAAAVVATHRSGPTPPVDAPAAAAAPATAVTR